MKRISTCVTDVRLTVALAVYLFLVVAPCSAAAGQIEPVGASIGVVQFDAVIELNRYSPDFLRHDYTVMFVRYWVARDYYSMAVVWAEPQSTDMFFAVHPPCLSVSSNGQEFRICHESIKKDNEMYKRPIGERGMFRCMFGSYPIDNIRFAEQEALATRIYAADLRRFQDANEARAEAFDLSIPVAEGTDARDIAQLKVQTSRGLTNSMQLFDAKKQLLKSISYEYENKGVKPYLRRQIVTLPERPLMVSFNGEGIKVTLDGKEYRYRELDAPHHAGGRRCTVEYEPVTLGGKKVPLPVRVTVRAGKDNQILRSVHLTNFKKVELDASDVEEAARQFGEVTPAQHEYEQFHLKYWKKAPEAIEKDDVEAIGQLRGRFEKMLAAENESPGEKLKHLNILMELNLILGDVAELERHYQEYLSTLNKNRLFELTLIGGYGVIETAMFQGRCNEASVLLNRWVDTVPATNDAKSVVSFAKRQLAKTRFWTTVKLLEKLSAKGDLDAGTRFETEALRCTALAELCKLLQASDLAEKGLSAKVESDWVASIGINNLKTILTNSISQASRFFAELPAPTEPQQALKQQLDKIDQEVKEDENKDSAD